MKHNPNWKGPRRKVARADGPPNASDSRVAAPPCRPSPDGQAAGKADGVADTSVFAGKRLL